jgi:hypothetical protein
MKTFFVSLLLLAFFFGTGSVSSPARYIKKILVCEGSFQKMNTMKSTVVITDYLYGIYYLFDVAAPLASKAFVFVLITLIFVIYVRQILKKSNQRMKRQKIALPVMV